MSATAKERDRRQGLVGLLALTASVPAGLLLWFTNLPPTPEIVSFQQAYLNQTSTLFTVLLDIGFCAILAVIGWRLAQRLVGVSRVAR